MKTYIDSILMVMQIVAGDLKKDKSLLPQVYGIRPMDFVLGHGRICAHSFTACMRVIQL